MLQQRNAYKQADTGHELQLMFTSEWGAGGCVWSLWLWIYLLSDGSVVDK